MLERETSRLRPMTEGDLPMVLAWRNLPAVHQYMYTEHQISEEEHRSWFERVSASPLLTPMIFEVDRVPMGLVKFTDFELTDRRCRWGFHIGDEHAPKGAGTALGVLALEYIFETRGMRKLSGEAFAFNEPSLRMHRRLGFIEEGRLLAHVKKNGRYEDILLMAHFADRWHEIKGTLWQQYLPEGVCV